MHDCTLADIPWIMEWSLKHYSKQIKDVEQTKLWFEHAVENPDVKILRTKDTAVVATCDAPFYDPEHAIAEIHFFGGNLWELPVMFRETVLWAKSKGAHKLFFASSTGYDVTPLAKRVGATDSILTHVMEI